MNTLFMVAILTGASVAQPGAADATKLEGSWALVSEESDGSAAPEEIRRSAVLKIEGVKYSLHLGELKLTGRISLNPTQSPKAIDLRDDDGVTPGGIRRGIYRIDGDRLTLCIARYDEKRPVTFSGAPGAGTTLQTWKRQGGK